MDDGPHGEFGDVVKHVLQRGQHAEAESDFTVGNINEHLDELCSSIGSREAQRAIVLRWMTKCSAVEMKWISRVILKYAMNLRVKERAFFNWLHPDADSVYKTKGTLAETLNVPQLRNPLARLTPELELGTPFATHNCEAFKVDLIHKQAQPILQGDGCLVEEKLDGERSLIHVTNQPDGSRTVQLFSRKRNPRPKLRAVLEPYLLEAIQLGVDVILDGETIAWDDEEGCIVDFGKNMTYAEEQLQARRRGDPAPSIRCMYRVFDILFVKNWAAQPSLDGCITQLPLRLRRQFLVQLVGYRGVCPAEPPTGDWLTCPSGAPLPGKVEVNAVVHLSDASSAATRWNTLRSRFQAVLDKGGEGLVVKSLNSQYVCDGRNGKGWMKVKPEYMAGYYDTMDMVVVAGFYGEGHRRTSFLSHFLLAVKDESYGYKDVLSAQVGPESLTQSSQATTASGAGEPAVPDSVVKMPKKWRVVAKVGTGYSLQELQHLTARLQRIGVEVAPSKEAAAVKRAETGKKAVYPEKMPSYIFGDSWVPRGDMVPDVIVDPQRSVVFEVIGAQLLVDEKGKYPEGVNMRFPRVLRIRSDKGSNDVNTWSEVQELMLNNDGMLRQRTDLDSRKRTRGAAQKPGKASRKSTKAPAGVISYMRAVNASSISAFDDLQVFSGKHFYVPSFSPSKYMDCPSGMQSNAEVQTALLQMGAASASTHYPKHAQRVYAVIPKGAESSAAVKALLHPSFKDKTDVLFPGWVLECRGEGTCVQLEPRHGHHFSAAGQAEVARVADMASGVVWHRPMSQAEIESIITKWTEQRGCKPSGAGGGHELPPSSTLPPHWWSKAVDTYSMQLPLAESRDPITAATLLCQHQLLSTWEGSVYFDWHQPRRIVGSGDEHVPKELTQSPTAGDLASPGAEADLVGCEIEWRTLGGRVAPCISDHVSLVVTGAGSQSDIAKLRSVLHPATKIFTCQQLVSICFLFRDWFTEFAEGLDSAAGLTRRLDVCKMRDEFVTETIEGM